VSFVIIELGLVGLVINLVLVTGLKTGLHFPLWVSMKINGHYLDNQVLTWSLVAIT